MNKNDNVIRAKNTMMQEYLSKGQIKEFKIKKGFAIITSESDKNMLALSSVFKSMEAEKEFDIKSIESGLNNSFHIAINDERGAIKSNIFIATSDSDVLNEQFEKAMKDKKIKRCGVKKVISIILNNRITYNALIEEGQAE